VYVANDQVYGAQTGPWAGGRLELRLGTVVTLLQPGDELRLLVEGENFIYARVGDGPIAPASLSNVSLRVPLADSELVGEAEVIGAD
ncbi:MAG: hypothetical protein AAF436_22535, partial [Myxococcota bacterium]